MLEKRGEMAQNGDTGFLGEGCTQQGDLPNFLLPHLSSLEIEHDEMVSSDGLQNGKGDFAFTRSITQASTFLWTTRGSAVIVQLPVKRKFYWKNSPEFFIDYTNVIHCRTLKLQASRVSGYFSIL